ncbi:MAG: hypothetical protein D3916_13815, partial [Candidatus Electrothrix sp. MAN1_4]|nr:hypothetical protein [Candidatus Electrothrix sp. MAN1_4]
MARQRKKTSPIKRIITTMLILLVAGGFLIVKGSTPEFLREYIPPELHAIFYPASTGTGSSNAMISNLPATEGNTSITSFSTAKTQLKKLYVKAGHFSTFYCGSTFDD